jgi:hypothetical protein
MEIYIRNPIMFPENRQFNFEGERLRSGRSPILGASVVLARLNLSKKAEQSPSIHLF